MTTVSELVSEMMPSSHAGVKGCVIRVGVIAINYICVIAQSIYSMIVFGKVR